jgi:hypothetical protein
MMIRALVLLLFLPDIEAAYVGGKSATHEHLTAGHAQKESSNSYFKMFKEKKEGVLGGVILGCLLWCAVPIAIFNTERISAKQAKMRFKAQRYAVHLKDENLEPFDELNGRIVYVQGETECSETLTDSEFSAVKSEGKIKLRRVVEMYQNVEHEREEGDDDNKRTVYYYTQEWSDKHEECPHDSSMSNPSFPFSSTRRQEAYMAWAAAAAGNGDKCAEAQHQNVTMGKYYLDDYVIRELTNWKDKEVTAEMIKTWKNGTPESSRDWWYYGGVSDSIGKVRIKFEELCPGPISICGVLCKNKQGWSFLPIIKKDAQGNCDSLVAECGTTCCCSVEELSYYTDEEDKVNHLKEQLEDRELEFDESDLNKLKKSMTMKESGPEDDMDDLCCSGPFGVLIKKFMNYVGLEDELLAVSEDKKSLPKLLNSEREAMEQKVNIARASTFFCLVFATLLIINPIMKLLNYNMLVTMLGGGLLSCIICCCAMMFTCSAYSCLVTSAWIWYRPFLAMVSLAVSIIAMIGVVYLCMEVYKEYKEGEAAQGGTAAFLAMRHTWEAFTHHM